MKTTLLTAALLLAAPARAGATYTAADPVVHRRRRYSGRDRQGQGGAKIAKHQFRRAGGGLWLYRALLEYRTGLTPPTVHHGQAELVTVVQGNATLVSGGHLTGVQPPRPGATTDTRHRDRRRDKSQQLAKGDSLLVPAETAHQFQDVKGEFVIISVHMLMPGK